MNESEVTQMGAVDEEEINTYLDFKKAVAKSDYRRIKEFKDLQPTAYEDFKKQMKQDEDEQRGIIKF
jgi:hypothetical protein